MHSPLSVSMRKLESAKMQHLDALDCADVNQSVRNFYYSSAFRHSRALAVIIDFARSSLELLFSPHGWLPITTRCACISSAGEKGFANRSPLWFFFFFYSWTGQHAEWCICFVSLFMFACRSTMQQLVWWRKRNLKRLRSWKVSDNLSDLPNFCLLRRKVGIAHSSIEPPQNATTRN